MAYVPVPKDLTKVKTKFLFGLTKRQVVCFGLGAIVGVPVFFLTKNTLQTSLASMVMIISMLPFFMFAMFEKHGQPLEIILQNFIQAKWIRPRIRIYQTENFYAAIDQDVRFKKEVNEIRYGTKRKKAQTNTNGKEKAQGTIGAETTKQ